MEVQMLSRKPKRSCLTIGQEDDRKNELGKKHGFAASAFGIVLRPFLKTSH
jgi:hypothetical protein